MEREIVIDAKNANLGRLASYVAKQTLLGKNVVIINAEEAIVLGNRKNILERYRRKFSRGGSSLKGPKIPKNPERILKRTIRGMLSHKQRRGSDALKRVFCYNGVPEKYEKSKRIIAGKIKKAKFLTLKEIVKELKGGLE